VLEAQRKGREEWLKVRELRGSGADPEETRARAREDWLKLREQQDRSPPGEATQERAKDRGAGIDDDSDT